MMWIRYPTFLYRFSHKIVSSGSSASRWHSQKLRLSSHSVARLHQCSFPSFGHSSTCRLTTKFLQPAGYGAGLEKLMHAAQLWTSREPRSSLWWRQNFGIGAAFSPEEEGVQRLGNLPSADNWVLSLECVCLEGNANGNHRRELEGELHIQRPMA